MKVLVATDKFAGTLTAPEAAAAIAEGWRRHAPDDEVALAPMADGGPGFVDVMHSTLGGDLLATTVTGPLGERVPAAVLQVGDTVYVESAQACGLDLVAPDKRDPLTATTYGVGELIVTALDAGAKRVVVGLGGSGTNDGGAGLLAALGATSTPEGLLTSGPAALARLDGIDVTAARERVAGIELLAASDVDNPLLGLRGATNVFGPQKGLTREQLFEVDGALTRLAHAAGREPADEKGAGAAGGLGYALLLLGGTRVPGLQTVADAVGLADAVRRVDLVVTGEGKVDPTTVSGKVVMGVAKAAQAAARPCIALAGRVDVSARELRANGIESAYAMVDLVGVEQAMGRPAESLSALAERVARTWSPRR